MLPDGKTREGNSTSPGQVLGVVGALAVCAYGAWVLTGQQSRSGIAPRHGHFVMEDFESFAQAQDANSFEDALLHLERANTPSKRTQVKGTPGKSARASSSKRGTGGSARRASATTEEEKEQAKDIIADFVKSWLPPEAGDAREIVDDALERIEREKQTGRAGEASKPSEADLEKARGIINDALQKLGAASTGDDKKDADLLKELLLKDAASADSTNGNSGKKNVEAVLDSHFEFADLLQKEREKKISFDISDVRKEFKKEFSSSAKPLLCSGCKLVAARLESELDTHDVHEKEDPASLLKAKRRALDAVCTSFRHVRIADEGNGPRYQAVAAPESPEEAQRPKIAQRLCLALLEDARFDMLNEFIDRKMAPELGMKPSKHNWERWLCARRARVCKKSEVREDEDDEDEGEL